MKRTILVLASLAIFFLAVTPADASTIVYTESATASGTLVGISFTNASVLITLTGDTSTLTGALFPGVLNVFGTATVFVSGVGTDSFTDSMDVFDTQGISAVGITDFTHGDTDVLDTFDAAFGSYGLTTAIGPITNSAGFNPGFSFATIGGTFVISSVSGPSTFTATLATTPEPSSLLLLGMGFAGLLGIRRNRALKAGS